MKNLTFLTIVILLISFTNLNAQESQKDFYWKKAEKFGRMKKTGVGLTIGGAVLTIVGIGLIADAAHTETTSYGYYNEPNEANLMAGVVALELGVGMTAGGIVLWSIGASKKNKYLNRIKTMTLNLNADSRQKLSLVYKF